MVHEEPLYHPIGHGIEAGVRRLPGDKREVRQEDKAGDHLSVHR